MTIHKRHSWCAALRTFRREILSPIKLRISVINNRTFILQQKCRWKTILCESNSKTEKILISRSWISKYWTVTKLVWFDQSDVILNTMKNSGPHTCSASKCFSLLNILVIHLFALSYKGPPSCHSQERLTHVHDDMQICITNKY